MITRARRSLERARLAACGVLCAALSAAGCLLPDSAARSASAAGTSAGADSPHNLLESGRFDDGVSLPWSASFTEPALGASNVVDGALCLAVRAPGKNRWDAQLRHRQLVIRRGHHYQLRFVAWADKPMRVRPKLGMAGPPYAEYWADTIVLGPAPQAFSAQLIMQKPDDPTAELAFHAGGELAPGSEPYRVCIDEVALEDPEFVRAQSSASARIPNVLVNQLGYLPGLQKLAVLKSTARTPLPFELLDARGERVFEGASQPFGADADSGDSVHQLDFSSFDTPGDGYRLRSGDDESHTFAIRADLYQRLRADALAFFYHQRSGVEIALPFAREARLVRPAGHLGDRAVACLPGSGCNYTLDASGGWYDAGDHGKYVVNGGIAVWTLLDLYERTARAGAYLERLGDNSLLLPESGNGRPDLLDEARVELEFLLKMQVRSGPLAGMVHHKLHDAHWTELGTAPHEDRMPRFLAAPSTAATLNVAAVAAQASRVFASIDAAFAGRCLAAAERAFAAAQAHPQRYASERVEGGGAYPDHDVRDEFYWAAAELFASTGRPEYHEVLARSPFFLRVGSTLVQSAADAGQHATLTWQNTEAAGTISLALAADALAPDERERARAAIVAAADALLELRARQGYRLPFAAGPKHAYPWGSNAFVLDNALLLALAYDFTQAAKYRDGVVSALDYILGENPLDQSYVTGYGARPLQHPHHRFFASQAVPGRPDPPPGFVSGGPNSGLEDPIARAAGLAGKPPERCFIDHIESFATNEVAINWNAPLAWVVAFVDDQARR